ncbi:MAG: hypothetical protein WCV70_04085, partial [Patescibacteria group bacterium]
MKKLFRKVNFNRKYFLLGLFILAVVVVLLPKDVNAGDVSGLGIAWDAVKTVVSSPILIAVGTIAVLVMAIFGALNGLVISALISITQYNTFISEPSIIDAWIIVRDLCNMFFILILLVIAFATILRLPSYEWKKLLPKLLIMAVLINFSRTICGLIIDASQVIMLTFVNAWGGAGNFVDTVKMAKYFMGTASKDWGTGDWSVLQVVAGMLIGIMFLIISGIVLFVAMAVFLMRIIMLWIYIVLSPIAFLAAAFPAGQKYATQWWSEFTKYIINGPVLAFFIWMALITSRQITKIGDIVVNQTGTSQCASINLGITQITCLNDFLPFILSIGMLLGGLMITQQIGGVGASIAGKGLDWAKRAPKLMGGGSLKVGSWAARKFAASKHGFEIRPSKVIAGFRETLAEKKRKEDIRIEEKSASMLKEGKLIRGGLGASRDFSEAAAKGFLWNRAWKVSGDPKKMGIMQSTWKAGGVRKNIEKLEKERDEKATTEKRKSEINNEIATQREEMAKYETPQTFYAHQKSMTAYQEAAKKSGMKDNEDEIVETFDKAIENGDNELAVGMILHAVEVGHGNEMLQKHRAKADVLDDNGNVVTKEGEFFRQDNSGMRGFFKQYVQGKMGLSEQEALSIQSQFSSRAKAVTHMNLSESVGKKNGLFYQRSDEEQQSRAHGETMKMDVETMLRKLNRIGQGSEIQYEDEDDNKKIKRRFVANGLTTKNFLKTAPTLDLEVNDRKRLNPNFAENTFVNYMMYEGNGGKFKEKSLVEIMDKLGTSYTTKEGGTISHKQLALETAAFGGEKYIANLLMKKIDAETSNASPAELKKIGEEIKNAEGVLSGVR